MTVTEPTPADTEASNVTEETEESRDTDAGTDRLVEDELLVEEISIDGMCGVY